MKYTPKQVFILVNDNYKEITYIELLKNKFQIQEDKTVKYTPKKVFILENGKYKEITYVYKRLETEIFGDENNE